MTRNIRDTSRLLPALRGKPALVRYWLWSARKAQVALLVALLLGVTLFHMITGWVPFKGDTRSVLAQVLTRDPPAPRSLNRSCPKALERLVLEMMAKAPGDRPRSMSEVKAALSKIRSSKR